jgi:hypothetical protein
VSTRQNQLVGSFQIKSKDPARRTFTGALSTSHLDLGDGRKRDIVWPGAFQAQMDEFHTSADAYIPLVDSHATHSIFNVLGHLLEGREVLTGKTLEYELARGGMLKVPEMFFETEWQVIDGPDGDRVLDRLRPGSVRKMSMGYVPLHEEDVELRGGPARILRVVGLAEGSLVIFAMNPAAQVVAGSMKAQQAVLKRRIRVLLNGGHGGDYPGLAARVRGLLRGNSYDGSKGELSSREQRALQQRLMQLRVSRALTAAARLLKD